MPAWRLDEHERLVRCYDVGAMDGSVPEFVRHLVLCVVEQPQRVNLLERTLPTVHMGPPLEAKDLSPDVIGTAVLDADGLSPAESRQIKVFVDDRCSESKAQKERLRRLSSLDRHLAEYVVHPPWIEPDEDVACWRFSCAGFVLKAYEEANIRLVASEDLPGVTLETLKTAYPRFAGLLDRSDVRARLGLDTGAAWPVVLAGYVVNALNRSPEAIRAQAYPPARGDEYFPSKSVSVVQAGESALRHDPNDSTET